MSDVLQSLVTALERARDGARDATGRDVAGVRAVELTPEDRHYLCALDSGGVVCLDARFALVDDEDIRVRVAGAALVVEHVEQIIDAAECAVVASLVPRVAELVDDDVIRASVGALGDAATRLAEWRSEPLGVVAAIERLDDAAALHAAVHAAYRRFVAATDPLVAVQASLPPDLVRALGDLENACGRAGIAGSMTDAVGAGIEAIMAGADELVAQRPD